MRYVCAARLNGRDTFFLWQSDDKHPDRVVVDDAGFIVTFPSEAAARSASLDISNERVSRYDFDDIDAWCRSNSEVVDCSALLNAWNMFGDIQGAKDLFAAADARANDLHQKLFYGCNLPAMTPPGEHYVPTWSASELADLKQLLRLGLAEFRARLR